MTAPQGRAERNRQIATLRGWTQHEDGGNYWLKPGAKDWSPLANFHTGEWTARLQIEMGDDGWYFQSEKFGDSWQIIISKGDEQLITQPTLADAVASAYIASKEGQ